MGEAQCARKVGRLASGFHLQGVIEAVEIVEESGDGGEFHDLAVVEVLAELGEELVGNAVRVASHLLGQAERSALGWRERFEIALF